MQTVKESDLLTDSTIAILGLGLMGGSLALALHGRCRRLLGVDTNEDIIAMALQRQVVDQATTHPEEILPQANIVILAAPVCAILELIHRLPDMHPGRAIVIDIGSTKTEVVRAMETLPPRFDPLGGHPICGKEKSSLTNAEVSLYEDAAFVFTPLAHTSDTARQVAKQLAAAIGAYPLWMDALTHDCWAAATSHLPYLLAIALALASPEACAPLAGPGFISTSRLAASPGEMMIDILKTNRMNILDALKRFSIQLESIATLLRCGEYQELEHILQHGALQREVILNHASKRKSS